MQKKEGQTHFISIIFHYMRKPPSSRQLDIAVGIKKEYNATWQLTTSSHPFFATQPESPDGSGSQEACPL